MFIMQDICELTSSIYIPRGVNVKSLSTTTEWPFLPSKMFKVKYYMYVIVPFTLYIVTRLLAVCVSLHEGVMFSVHLCHTQEVQLFIWFPRQPAHSVAPHVH